MQDPLEPHFERAGETRAYRCEVEQRPERVEDDDRHSVLRCPSQPLDLAAAPFLVEPTLA